MNYLPLQIIVTLLVVFVVFRLVKKLKEHLLTLGEFISWLLIWVIVGMVFWLPQTTSYLALFLGIGRGVDLAIYCAILIIFYLVLKLYLKIDKQQKEITKIIRHLALKDEEKISAKGAMPDGRRGFATGEKKIKD